MEYTVMSPWAEVDTGNGSCLNKRIDSLSGKTIGLYAHFKIGAVTALKQIGSALAERFPDTKFKFLQYERDTMEIYRDSEFDLVMKEWLSDVDGVIASWGDMGSCAMFLGYNVAYIEKQGIPTVTLVDPAFEASFLRGARARLVPNPRLVYGSYSGIGGMEGEIPGTLNQPVEELLSGIIAGLTMPLTAEELLLPKSQMDYATMRITGNSYAEVNRIFYEKGWTTGVPICLPTEEAVEEMLRGTDLPRNYVVAELPPMNGKATVEKIAINAVMAGCLPIHLPVLIAAVKGLVSPCIHLEGWTCSADNWSPMMILSGPIRKDIDVSCKRAALSQYRLTNAVLGRAMNYIVMNISGCRPGLEDMSQMGSESRVSGIVFGEDEENSPWAPLHTDFGFSSDDSAITLFWPNSRSRIMVKDPDNLLESMCNINVSGFDPGCAYVLSAEGANMLNKAGYSKQDVIHYIYEYARIPSEKVNMNFIVGNNHIPKYVPLPAKGDYSARKFWTDEHLILVVSGYSLGMAFSGGGDHGGPSCTKIELPAAWPELVKEYGGIRPNYINY